MLIITILEIRGLRVGGSSGSVAVLSQADPFAVRTLRKGILMQREIEMFLYNRITITYLGVHCRVPASANPALPTSSLCDFGHN